MPDITEKIGNSLIQHGKSNDRVYVMKLDPVDLPEIVGKIDSLAEKHGYSKIFAKVPVGEAKAFLSRGYDVEARVPGFFGGVTEGLFLARYLDTDRRQNVSDVAIEKVLSECKRRHGQRPSIGVNSPLKMLALDPGHATAIASVYRRIFETYPFPIHDPEYIAHTMEEEFVYFGVFDGADLVAVSSAEIDLEQRNAEMTDFATLPDYRGMKLSIALLARMEIAGKKMGVTTAFTIARALSFGMNITFARMNYTHAGTLYNNTNIGGGLESMNVWYKSL